MSFRWLFALLLQAGAGTVLAGEEGPAAVTLKGADLQLLGEVRRIATNVETVRGEPFVRPPLAVRVADDMRGVAAEIRASNVLPRPRLEARGRAWADLGLGGPDTPAVLLRTLATDLEGIGFDPEGNRLLVAPDRLVIEDFVPSTPEQESMANLLQMTGVRIDEPLVAHLLTHVRQRERGGHDVLEPTTDRMLAAMAWAEGEANLVAVLYLFHGMNLGEVVLDHDLDPGEVLEGRLLPREVGRASGVERRMLDFVYREGFARAVESYRKGGWPAIGEAMRQGRTTRALLHPGAAEAPAMAAADPPAIPGLHLADEDSLGQQGVVVLVSLGTGKDNLGLVAADGWAGDRLLRWEDDAGLGLTEWRTRWTDEAAADDFVYGIGRTLAARFPGATPKTADGSLVVESGGLVFRTERSGPEVRVRIAPAAWDARLQAGRAGAPGS